MMCLQFAALLKTILTNVIISLKYFCSPVPITKSGGIASNATTFPSRIVCPSSRNAHTLLGAKNSLPSGWAKDVPAYFTSFFFCWFPIRVICTFAGNTKMLAQIFMKAEATTKTAISGSKTLKSITANETNRGFAPLSFMPPSRLIRLGITRIATVFVFGAFGLRKFPTKLTDKFHLFHYREFQNECQGS